MGFFPVSLLGVLIRFWQERVAVQGDIETMFHQVIVPKKDGDSIRFLWCKDRNNDVEPKQNEFAYFGGNIITYLL